MLFVHRLEFRKWQVNKELIKARMEQVQTRVKELIGVLVDVKHGAGNKNCGNTARRFFDDPDLWYRKPVPPCSNFWGE